MALNPIAQQMYASLLKTTLQTINSISTVSADARRLYSLLQSQDYAGSLLLDQWLKDMIQGVLLNVIIGLACSPLYVTRGLMGGFGLGMWLNQFEADLNSGDRELILYDIMQAGSLLGSFCCKCFTGDTLVRTGQGFTRIDEIRAGDYVLAENIETGKKEYRKVLKVYVKEATSLVHLRTDGTKDEDQTIDTTANHPFYVEGRGWVAAKNIEIGDQLHTEDGSVVRVTAKETEKLKKPVKVYNLEVEGYHTYYVTKDEVLVHNMYGSGSKKISPYDLTPTHNQTKSNKKMQRLVNEIKINGIIEPIKYVEYNGTKYVVDGHHRLLAAKKLKLNKVPVEEVQLPYGGYRNLNDILWYDEY